jgi:hypothetical protein
MHDADRIQIELELWPTLSGFPRDFLQGKARALVERYCRVAAADRNKTAQIGPLAGIVEGFFEAGMFPSGSLKHRLAQYWLLFCTKTAMRRLGDRPGVNDFLMAKWLILRDPGLVKKIVERTQHPDPAVAMSCSWMLESASLYIPQLADQLAKFTYEPVSRKLRELANERA